MNYFEQHNPMQTLFLDRDGVINVRKMGGYITSYSEFRFIDGALEAMKIFNNIFDHIFIVTNQQGIGKGLMTDEDFLCLNDRMLEEIRKNGGRVDKVYYCSALKSENSIMRKPQVGMALLAKNEYQLNLSNSIMVGDSMSDMRFGKSAGMHNVFIDNHTEEDIDENLFEIKFSSLSDFAKYLKEMKNWE